MTLHNPSLSNILHSSHCLPALIFCRDDLYIEADVQFPAENSTHGVFVAARVNQAGCEMNTAQGVFFYITTDKKYWLTRDAGTCFFFYGYITLLSFIFASSLS